MSSKKLKLLIMWQNRIPLNYGLSIGNALIRSRNPHLIFLASRISQDLSQTPFCPISSTHLHMHFKIKHLKPNIWHMMNSHNFIINSESKSNFIKKQKTFNVNYISIFCFSVFLKNIHILRDSDSNIITFMNPSKPHFFFHLIHIYSYYIQ